MLCRGGKQVAPNASCPPSALMSCTAVSLHSLQSASSPLGTPVGLSDRPVTFLAAVLMPFPYSWPDSAGSGGQAIVITSTPLPMSRPDV